VEPGVAHRIASRHHVGQRNRFGDPVIDHVERVAAAVPPDVRATALLHDLLELCPAAQRQLRRKGLTPIEREALVLRVESGLFFANADTIRKEVLAHATDGTKTIVLDGQTVPFIDVTAAQMLEALAEDLDRDGIQFLLARDVGQVRDVVSREDQDDRVVIRAYPTVQAAVTAAGKPSKTGSGK
jgi:MFS superfamily sulfate permease-like transporter